MSGAIENLLDKFASQWIPKIPYMEKLTDRTERQIAGGHVTLMAMLTLLPLAIAAVTNQKIICVASYLTLYLIWNAERPPIGRSIDIITRMIGWAIGCIFSTIYLFK